MDNVNAPAVSANERMNQLADLFPRVKVVAVGDKVKFNVPELSTEQVLSLAVLPDLRDISIKRSGSGLVVLLK